MAGIIKVDRVQSDSNLAFNIAGANVAFMDASALRLVGSSIVANGTTIVSGSKVVTAAQPAGSVLQVVQAYKTDTQTINSTTWVDVTGLSVSITPSSTSSKILVMCDVSLGAANEGGLRWVRDGSAVTASLGTEVGTTASNFSTGIDDGFSYASLSATSRYLDSPATTSTITYKVQAITPYSTGRYAYINRYPAAWTTSYSMATTSSIILMEIAQ